MEEVAFSQVDAWLLTYLLHSTLLLLSAALLVRLLPSEALAARERLWRLALLGGLLTATLQPGLGIEPWSGRFHLSAATSGAVAATADPMLDPLADRTPGPMANSAPFPSRVSPDLTTAPETATVSGSPHAPALAARPLRLSLVWIGLAALLLLRLLGRYLSLNLRLRDRRRLGGELLSRLDRLRRRAGVRTPVALCASARIGAPLARGIVRPEICLPEERLTELSRCEQQSVLAHELAHIRRRDPAWLLLYRLLEAALFLQPLNRLASRNLQEIAEYRSDDWTVLATGRPLALARTLTRVAGWNGTVASVAAPLTERRSNLSRRVRRLLQPSRGSSPMRNRRAVPIWLAPVAAAVLVLVLLIAPGISATPQQEEAAPDPDPSAAPLPPLPPLPAAVPAPEVMPSPSLSARLAPLPPTPPGAPAAPAPPTAPRPTGLPPLPPLPPAPAEGEAWHQEIEILERDLAAELGMMEEEVATGVEALERALELEMRRIDAEVAAEIEPEIEQLASSVESLIERRLRAAEAERQALELELQALQRSFSELERDLRQALDRQMREVVLQRTELAGRAERLTREALERAHHQRDMARLVREGARAGRQGEVDQETRDRLLEEARRLAAEARPSREELQGVRAELSALIDELGPMREELDRWREELRRELLEWRQRQTLE